MNRISGIVISLMLRMLLVLGIKSQAQIVLEHTYSSGIYIYEYNGISTRFVVSK